MRSLDVTPHTIPRRSSLSPNAKIVRELGSAPARSRCNQPFLPAGSYPYSPALRDLGCALAPLRLCISAGQSGVFGPSRYPTRSRMCACPCFQVACKPLVFPSRHHLLFSVTCKLPFLPSRSHLYIFSQLQTARPLLGGEAHLHFQPLTNCFSRNSRTRSKLQTAGRRGAPPISPKTGIPVGKSLLPTNSPEQLRSRPHHAARVLHSRPAAVRFARRGADAILSGLFSMSWRLSPSSPIVACWAVTSWRDPAPK